MSTQFLFNLARSLSHTIRYELEQEFPSVYCAEFRNGGDPPPQPVGETTQEMLNAYTQGLPGLMNITNQQIGPNAQAQLGAAQQTAPGYNQLQANMVSQFAPQLAQTGNQVNAITQQGNAAANLATLQGAGGQLAQQGQALSKQLDPEYYATRTASANALAPMLAGQLTGGQNESIQRGIDSNAVDTGNNRGPDNVQAAQAGMQYGNASQDRITQALQLANGAMPNMQSAIGSNPLNVATGQSGQNNFGLGQFMGANQNAGSGAMTMAGNLLGQTSALQQQSAQNTAQMRNSLDSVNSTLSSLPT